MAWVANIVVAAVALLHVYFLVLEMFLWDRPAGLRAFGQTLEAAKASKVLAANQGLYNGFLAAGLVWGLTLGASGTNIKVFFLSCVLIAGLYGAATASRKILFVQALPAAVGLALVAPGLRQTRRAMEHDTGRQPTPTPEQPHRPLPQGYRQGIITAITVLLGFSLAFFRFWGFEASGEWAARSIIAAGTLVAAVLLQIVALVRSLRLEDDDPNEYRKTVLWFTTSAVVLLIGLLIATLVFAGTPETKSIVSPVVRAQTPNRAYERINTLKVGPPVGTDRPRSAYADCSRHL